MIKRTLYFGNPARLRVKDLQLVIERQDEKNVTVPLEDLGFIVLDHFGITISHYALNELMFHNVMVITTDETHMPAGMFLPMAGNHAQTESFRAQINAPVPTHKRIWQATIRSKILNQAALLDRVGATDNPLRDLALEVQSGDVTNREAAAAKLYWQLLFDPYRFKRHRYGKPPNNLLNYGYAILRGVIARALCGAGLLPMLGVHHHNRNNPFPLADDIMEPYRPFVDDMVWNMAQEEPDIGNLTPELKKILLEIPATGVMMQGEVKPLHLAAARTAASVKRCFTEGQKRPVYPSF